jgi:transposase
LSLLPLTVPEVRRLLLALTEPPDRFGFHLQWSRWRRRHQAVAKRCHTLRRAQRYAAVPQQLVVPLRQPAEPETVLAVPRTDLTEVQWLAVAPLLPRPRQRQGRPAHDVRQMVQAMLWVEQTGCPWRSLPTRFGAWQDVYALYHRWRQSGLWLRIRQALQPASLQTAAA